MITIGLVKKTIDVNYCRVSAEIDNDGYKKELFFEVSKEYENYLSDEIADGFLVGLLVIAMKSNSDITIESPISERLLYGLKTFMMPALSKMNSNLKTINLHTNRLSSDNVNIYNGVATGVSGGVDSFYTIINNIEPNVSKSHAITHLVLFNAGNFGLAYEASLKEFVLQIEKIKLISEALGIPLVWVNSNLMEFVQLPFGQVHTFCNVASALILQKLIKTFYYSSGHSIRHFKLSFNDSSYYDLINAVALRTEGFEMISIGGLVSRFEKTKYIADYNYVRDNLNVCVNNEKARTEIDKLNCSNCPKCIRTMTNLDVIGELKKFENVFDLVVYEKNKAKYWGNLRYIKWRGNDEFAIDNIDQARVYKYDIPIMSYVWMIHKGMMNQFHKLIKN